MSCGIYKITNKINGHAYIGQSIHIEERWTDEKYASKTVDHKDYDSILSRAFRKYGIENFNFEILERCSKEDLMEKEQYYINKYDTYFHGYNGTTGGEGNPNNYIKISPKDLLEIYRLLKDTTIPQKDIAKQFNVGQDVISTINHGKSRRLEGYSYPLRNNRTAIQNYCIECGKPIDKKATRCNACYRKTTRKVADRPDREELKNLIRNNGFTAIGKMYGVRDNTVRKWCAQVNLPTRMIDIQKYSDEEWKIL